MSGLGKCARQQVWGLQEAKDEEVEADTPGAPWQNLMGYAGQAIVAKIVVDMGYTITDQEKPVYLPGIPGHIDGKLSGLDLDSPVIWDNKVRNQFAYYHLAKDGIDKVTRVQQQCYMAAEKCLYSMLTFVPFDLSGTRSHLNRWKSEANPQIMRVMLPYSEEEHETIEKRTQMIQIAVDNRITVTREEDPEKGEFPCTWCPFMKRCLATGQTTDFMVTPI